MSYEVFIPYSNERVWQQARGAAAILERLRDKQGRKERRELQPAFEEWAVEYMTYDWGLDGREGGMAFQFGFHEQATFFKLTWGAV